VLPLLWLGCSDYNLNPPGGEKPSSGASPAIVVTPAELSFPELRVVAHESWTETIVLANVGEATLELDEVAILGDPGVYSVEEPPIDALEPDQKLTLDVTFQPRSRFATPSLVQIRSNDPDDPLVDVGLFGQGIAPDLQFQPPSLALETVLPGCTIEQDIAIENVGTDVLTISGISLDGETTALTWAPVDFAVFPWTLAPEEAEIVRVSYAPKTEGDETATLQVASNDPAEAIAVADLAATSGHGSIEDLYAQPELPAADILFVIDDSTSMSDEQSALATYGSRLVGTLDASTTEWQIAVITTSAPTLRGPVITPDLAGAVTEFETQIVPGVGGAHAEKGIEMAYEALHAAAGPGTPFFRDHAKLILVFVSDEEEQSALVDPWDAAAYLQSVKDPGMVFAHSITALYGDGCVVESYGTRYAELTALVGGMRMSICDDWSSIVDDLASGSVYQLDRFALSRTPLPDTIVVRVDGHPATGWRYDDVANEIVFVQEDAVPEGGSEIAITYDLGGCDP
jgi:hypothetical protein